MHTTVKPTRRPITASISFIGQILSLWLSAIGGGTRLTWSGCADNDTHKKAYGSANNQTQNKQKQSKSTHFINLNSSLKVLALKSVFTIEFALCYGYSRFYALIIITIISNRVINFKSGILKTRLCCIFFYHKSA